MKNLYDSINGSLPMIQSVAPQKKTRNSGGIGVEFGFKPSNVLPFYICSTCLILFYTIVGFILSRNQSITYNRSKQRT
jgi:hypothetical protein